MLQSDNLMSQNRPFAKTNLRDPPQDLSAEQALLGAIMLRPKSLPEVVEIVHPIHFYAEKHRLIYQAMLDLDEKGEPIDAISLGTTLKERKKMEQAGGASY